MKNPRVTGPLFSETAKGSIKEFGTFRTVGGKTVVEQKRKGPKLPPAASAEMRARFAEAWDDYLALPPTKPRTGNGAPVYRQPAWGQFWREWWAIYQLGGVFNGRLAKSAPFIYLSATGKIARTGNALLIVTAPTIQAGGGDDAGVIASMVAQIGGIELECTNDPYFIPRVNRARTNSMLDDITASAQVETRQFAVIQQTIEDVTCYSEVLNPVVTAVMSRWLDDVTSSGMVEVPYETARLNGALDDITGAAIGE